MSACGWLSGIVSGASRRNFSFSKDDNLCYTTTSTGTPTSSCFSERHGCERYEDTRTTSTDFNSLRGRNLSRRTEGNTSLGSPCERGGSNSRSGSASRWSASEASTDYRNDSYDGRGAGDGRRGRLATPDYRPNAERSKRNIQINYNPRRKAHKHIMKTTIGQRVKWEHTEQSRLGRRRLSFTDDTNGTAEWSETESSYRSPLSPSWGSEEDFDNGKSEYTDTGSSVSDDREWRRGGRQNIGSGYTPQSRGMSGKYGEKRPIAETKGKHAPTRNVGNRGRLVERGSSGSSEARRTRGSSSASSSSKSHSIGDRRTVGDRYKEQRNGTAAKTEKKVRMRRVNQTDKSRPLTNGVTSLLKTIHEHVEEERVQSGSKQHGQGSKQTGKGRTERPTVIKMSNGQTMLLDKYFALHPNMTMSKVDDGSRQTPSEFGAFPRTVQNNGRIPIPKSHLLAHGDGGSTVSDMRCLVSSSTQTEIHPKQKFSEGQKSVQEATQNPKTASAMSSPKYQFPADFTGQPHYFYPDEMDNDMQLPMYPLIPISLQPVPTAPSQKVASKKGKSRSRSQRRSSVVDRSRNGGRSQSRNGGRSQSRNGGRSQSRNGGRSQSRNQSRKRGGRRAIKKNNERQRSRQSRSLRRNSRSQSSRHVSHSRSVSAANTSDIQVHDGRTAEGTRGIPDQVDNYDYGHDHSVPNDYGHDHSVPNDYGHDHSVPTTHQMDTCTDSRLEEKSIAPQPKRTVLRTAQEIADAKEQAEIALRPRGGNFFTAPAARPPCPVLDEVGPVYRRLSAGQSSVAWTFHHTPLGSFHSGLHSERFHDSPEYAAAKSIARKYVPLVARRNRQMCC